MAFEVIDEGGTIIRSCETKEKAVEFVDEDERDLAIIDTSNEELVYP